MSLWSLLNPSRAFLAVSAVLAGYCLFRYAANTTGNILVLPYLLAAGAFLGMADGAWHAIFTAATENGTVSADAPSGTLSPTASYFVAVFTTLAGLMCAMTGGYNSFRAGAAMILLMLTRSMLFRNVEIVSPCLKGLTAAMLFAIGMTAHPAFLGMLDSDETRIPAAYFALYMVIVGVLAQARDSARPRKAPAGDELATETASRLLEMRDDTIDRPVVWFGGGALVLIPLVTAWVMPWQWLSWALLGVLAISTLLRLIPVLAYRNRKDLADFVQASYRGGALLSAGAIASLGRYMQHPVFNGWSIPMPDRNDQLAAVAIIALLASPAWLLRRLAPLE